MVLIHILHGFLMCRVELKGCSTEIPSIPRKRLFLMCRVELKAEKEDLRRRNSFEFLMCRVELKDNI